MTNEQYWKQKAVRETIEFIRGLIEYNPHSGLTHLTVDPLQLAFPQLNVHEQLEKILQQNIDNLKEE